MSTSDDMLLCQVYRSPRKADTYLYTERGAGLSRVPAALLDAFGEPQPALTFKLFPERRLAQANAEAVIREIREKGFFLQMPPPAGHGDVTVEANGAD